MIVSKNEQFVSAEVVNADEGDGQIQLSLVVASDTSRATVESWLQRKIFRDFADRLTRFPAEGDIVLEVGSKTAGAHSFCKLRAFVYDSVGHAALEVDFCNNSVQPYGADCHFYVRADISSLNNLGASLAGINPDTPGSTVRALLFVS